MAAYSSLCICSLKAVTRVSFNRRAHIVERAKGKGRHETAPMISGGENGRESSENCFTPTSSSRARTLRIRTRGICGEGERVALLFRRCTGREKGYTHTNHTLFLCWRISPRRNDARYSTSMFFCALLLRCFTICGLRFVAFCERWSSRRVCICTLGICARIFKSCFFAEEERLLLLLCVKGVSINYISIIV